MRPSGHEYSSAWGLLKNFFQRIEKPKSLDSRRFIQCVNDNKCALRGGYQLHNFHNIAELQLASTNGLLLRLQGPQYIFRNLFRSIDNLFQYRT